VPPLLVTELKDAFDQIRDALFQEIKPRGFILRAHVDDYTYLSWEIRRYRRCNAAIINRKFRASDNSYRHGLAATIPSTAERARRVERLARKIAAIRLTRSSLNAPVRLRKRSSTSRRSGGSKLQ